MSIDFHVFRSEEIVPLVQRVSFSNPNQLEEALFRSPLPAPKLVCGEETPIVNLPVNRVQDTSPNRHAGSHDQEDLNSAFLAGRRLALEPIAGVRQISTHHELTLEWEPEAAQDDLGAFVVAAHAGELGARPELLAAYADQFGAGDDATLVVLAPDEGDAAVVAGTIDALGLGDGGPDILLLQVPRAEGETALAGRASAVLTGTSPAGPLARLPRVDAAAAVVLRALADAREPGPAATPRVSPAPPTQHDRAILAEIVPPDRLAADAPLYERYLADLAAYRALPGAEPLRAEDLMPKVHDRSPTTPYDQHYFHQDVWAARRVAERRPARHVDVGSRVDYVGFLTALTDVVFVDIRPLDARIEGLTSVAGSALELPFDDRSIESLSCLHVAEHIGLGRYGDPLDPDGTRKAARELQRVLGPGGELLVGVPVGQPRTCFNAHRIFDPHEVPAMFDELVLLEFAGVDDRGEFGRRRRLAELAGARYACGLYRLARPVA
jgi:SAM-dependent methyltransferase